MMLEVRAFLNEGGKLLYTGRHAGWQFANAFDYNPVSTPPLCDAVDLEANDGCLFLSDDFLQYWLGGVPVRRGRRDRLEARSAKDHRRRHRLPGEPAPTSVRRATTESMDDQPDVRGRPGRDDAVVHHHEQHPQDRGLPAVHELGAWGVGHGRRGRLRATHRRLLHVLAAGRHPVPAADEHVHGRRRDDDLSFFVSYDTEPNWDFVFVELQGEDDDWVTLPRPTATRATAPASPAPRVVRAAPLARAVPGRRLGADGDGISDWNAASGRSNGWEEWEFDLDGLRRPRGRGLDLLRERLGGPGARDLGRRHRRPGTSAPGADTGFETGRGAGQSATRRRSGADQRAGLDPNRRRRLHRGRR